MSTNNEGLSVALPLNMDSTFGAYNLNTTFEDLAKQNLKMLVLTNPGERMMDPSFGCGVRAFLFEPNAQTTYDDINETIKLQVAKYLPYISIDRVEFQSGEPGLDLDPNFLGINLFFTIVPLQIPTFLQISANGI